MSHLFEQSIELAGVPALASSYGEALAAARRGTVLLLHGLTVSKEAQRTEALSLARHGYLAVSLDAVGHGARRYPDFEQRFAADGEGAFFDTVRQTAAELPAVLAALRERAWALPGRVGACGISMGGYVLFAALAAQVALDAVVTLVASPQWPGRADSPHLVAERFAPVALFMQTASDDQTVPPSGARALHQALLPRYADSPHRLAYLEHDGIGHMFSEQSWHLAWGETLRWFDRFLVG